MKWITHHLSLWLGFILGLFASGFFFFGMLGEGIVSVLLALLSAAVVAGMVGYCAYKEFICTKKT